MKIKNVTTSIIAIGDLPGPQGSAGISIPPDVEVLLFDEDAEKSGQLAALIDSNLIQITGSEEPSTGQSNATQSGLPLAPGATPVRISGTPTPGQIIVADSASEASWQTGGGGGPIPDASTTAKGVTKLSVAPVLASNPIAAGDNDPRMSDARAPLSHALAGAEHSASTLAQLNAKISDAVLIDTNDARLSDSRAPAGPAGGDLAGTYPNPDVVKIDGVALSGTPSAGQVLTATSSSAANWQTPTGGGGVSGSGTAGKLAKWSAGTALSDSIISEAGQVITVAGDVNVTGMYKVNGVQIASANLSDAANLITTATALGGDLSGTLPNPVVAKINGLTVMANPSDNGEVLRYNGAAYVGQNLASTDLSDSAILIKSGTAAGGDLSGTYPNPQVADVDGATGLLAQKQKVEVQKGGTIQGTRAAVNLIEGANVTLTVADNPGQDRVDITVAASGGGGGPSTDFNGVSLYQAVTTSGETVWIKSSSTIQTGLSWSRSGLVLTVNHTAHGRSVGDRVIVRNTNQDYQSALIATVPNSDSFTISTANTGAESGSGAAYGVGFTFAHNAAAGSITSGTMTAPAGANVQLMSLRVFLAANTRQTTTYDVILPASVVNGAGGNSGEDDLYVPITAVRQQSSGSDVTMTSVGFTLTKAIGGNFSRFQLAALGATTTPINIQMSF